jgi:hypothetical protein
MSEKQKIEKILENLSHSEKIIILESLCKKYRRINSALINEKQMGRYIEKQNDKIEKVR